MDIYTLTRKLKSARHEAQKQSKIADDFSRQIVQLLRQHLKDSHTPLSLASKRSGIPQARLVNWLSGSFDHCLPADQVTILWNAITPTEGQKPSFSHQLRNLPASEWVKDNKTLAKEIGCSKEHVRLFRKSRSTEKALVVKGADFLKEQSEKTPQK